MPLSFSIRTILLFTGFFFFIGKSHAQQRKIQGVVKDSVNGETLENATISVYRLPDSVLVLQTRSTKSGYAFRREAGDYLLITSFVGYNNGSITFSILPGSDVMNMRPVKLVKSGTNLTEVVVRSVVPPVVFKNDTIIFNTGSFNLRPHSSVEELLRKLPGVEVDRDGNVTVQGRRVEKIFIDGKEFLLNDPKLATQNLLAEMVDKIEAFDNKSELAKRTGIVDPNAGKAINLRLKPGKKKSISGKVYAGYGNRNRYAGGGFITRFRPDNMLMSALRSGNTSGMFDPNNLRPFAASMAGDNLSNSFSFANTVRLNKKLNFTVNGNAGNSNTSVESGNMRQTLLTDSSLINERRSDNFSTQRNVALVVNAGFQPDSLNTIKIVAGINAGKQYTREQSFLSTTVAKATSYLLNEGTTRNKSESKNLSGNMLIDWTRNLSARGRLLQIILSRTSTRNSSDQSLYSFTKFISDTVTRDQLTNQDVTNNNTTVKISYAEPVGKGKVIDLSYSLQVRTGKSDRFTNNFDPASGAYNDPDTTATNQFRNNNTSHQWSVGYNYTRQKFRSQVGVAILKTIQSNKDLTGHAGDIEQSQVNFAPRLIMGMGLSKSKSINFHYMGNSISPTIQQLQPVPDYSNPLLIKLGSPDLKQEFTHELNASYTKINKKTFAFTTATVAFTTISNRIVNSTTVNAQGVQEQRFVNVNGIYNLSTIVNGFWMLGKERSGNIKTENKINYGKDVSLLNGKKNIRTSTSWSQSFNLTWNINKILQTNFTATTMLGNSRYSLQASSNSFFNQMYMADVACSFPGQVTVTTNFSMQRNSRQGGLPAISNSLLNATITKRIFRAETGELRFTAFDILRKNKGVAQSVGDNYFEITQTNVLQRFYIIAFSWRFAKMGGKK